MQEQRIKAVLLGQGAPGLQDAEEAFGDMGQSHLVKGCS